MLATRTDEVPVTVDNSRREPTVLTHGNTYRRGVGAPEGSSLPFFVLIGLAVGLFAFAMMHFCLPDPFEKIAARDAATAHALPPLPVFKPLEAAPPPPVAEPADVMVTSIAPAPAPPPAKQARVTRRQTTKKVGAKLPSNPYTSAN